MITKHALFVYKKSIAEESILMEQGGTAQRIRVHKTSSHKSIVSRRFL